MADFPDVPDPDLDLWGQDFLDAIHVAHNDDGTLILAHTFRIKVIDDATALATGENKYVFTVTPDLNGTNLTDFDIAVSTPSTSGAPSVAIRNVTDSQEMLSVNATIEINEYSSYTAEAQPAIDTAHDDVVTGDRLAIDVDAAGTGTKGLEVFLTFEA